MNEIQIIQSQLATERAHFVEITNLCAAALEQGKLPGNANLAVACADYFAFAVTRLPGVGASPKAQDSTTHWREFLQTFNDRATHHFATVDELRGRNLAVTEWRTRSGINADSIVMERERYARVKAAVP